MNKKFLTLAVGSALAFGGVLQTASSQVVTPGGLGDKLLGSYYTVNNGNDTLISIVNTTDRAKALKVRFREGRGSIDVLDLHVYLSPYDVWTAGITERASDGAAVIFSNDTSCTVPFLSGDAEADLFPVGPGANDVPRPGLLNPLLIPAVYEGDVQQRVREGYIEIIEMADFGAVPEVQLEPTGYEDRRGQYSTTASATRMNAADFRWATKHDDGVPRDCQAVRQFSTNQINPTNVAAGSFAGQLLITSRAGEVAAGNPASLAFENFRAPTGGLFGNVAIVNVPRAYMVSYEMDAINSQFASGFSGTGNNGNIFFSQNTAEPGAGVLTPWTADRGIIWEKGRNLAFADLPDLSTITSFSGAPTNTIPYYFNTDSVTDSGNVTPGQPDTPVFSGYRSNVQIMDVTELAVPIGNALSAVSISNEFVTDSLLLADTDWVVTFPTKRFHAAYRYNPATGLPVPTHRAAAVGGGEMDQLNPGFNGWIEPFSSGFNQRLGEACNNITLKAWNRDEGEPSGLLNFSPTRGATPQLCYEVNVVSFNNPVVPSAVLGGVDTRVDVTVPLAGDDPLNFENGWAIMGFPGASVPGQGQTELFAPGLPVIGFQAQVLVNPAIGIIGGSYGSSFVHRKTTAN